MAPARPTASTRRNASLGIAGSLPMLCTAASLATETPILQTHDDALTSYLGAASAAQDVLPLAAQRGVNLDGSLRARGGPPMSLAGNPFGESWNGNMMLSGVRLDTGAISITDVDLALPSPGFSWVIGRSYNAVQEDDQQAHHDSGGYQGVNWFQLSQPELVFYEDGQDAADDLASSNLLLFGLLPGLLLLMC